MRITQRGEDSSGETGLMFNGGLLVYFKAKAADSRRSAGLKGEIMKNLLKQWIAPVLVLGLGGLGQALKAQEIELKQIRGQQAIVELPPELSIQPGQKLILRSEGAEREGAIETGLEKTGPTSTSSRSRRFLMSASFNFGSTEAKEGGVGDYKRMDSMVGVRYGLNLGILEIGGLSESMNAVTRYEGEDGKYEGAIIKPGLFLELNLIRNQEPNNLIPGFGLDVAWIRWTQKGTGITNPPDGDYKNSLKGWSVFPHGYLKWFWPGTSGAMKLNLGYRVKKVSGSGLKRELGRIEMGGAISVYF